MEAKAAFIDVMAATVAALPSAAGTTRTYQVTLDACSARSRRERVVVLAVTHAALTPRARAVELAALVSTGCVAADVAAAALGTVTTNVMTMRGTGVAEAAAVAEREAVAAVEAEAAALAMAPPLLAVSVSE
jgi:hypothetical protein